MNQNKSKRNRIIITGGAFRLILAAIFIIPLCCMRFKNNKIFIQNS